MTTGIIIGIQTSTEVTFAYFTIKDECEELRYNMEWAYPHIFHEYLCIVNQARDSLMLLSAYINSHDSTASHPSLITQLPKSTREFLI